MSKRLLSVLLILILLVSVTGCTGSTEPEGEESSQSEDVSTVPTKVIHSRETPGVCYDASDSFSPYKAKTRVNRQLSYMIYEGLATIQKNYMVTWCLAEKVQKQSETVWTITIRKNAKFSDGSAVKASDVITSFEAAKKSDMYASLVEGITSIKTEKDGKTIRVQFATAFPWRERALSFPIVKNSLGTGPYKVDKKNKKLVANSHAPNQPLIAQWRLENISRSSEQPYALESQTVSYYFSDLEDGYIPQSVSGTQVRPVTMPYLVYMGIKSSYGTWANTKLRKALSEALSNSKICSASAGGYGTIATGLFPPEFNEGKDWIGLSPDAQQALAKADFEEAGFGKDKPLSVTLLLPKSSKVLVAAGKEIATELRATGVKVSISSLEDSSYKRALSAGSYDFYLAEIRLPSTLNMDVLLTSAGSGSYGVSQTLKTAYASYKSGKTSAADLHETFMEDRSLLPLFWRQGVAVYATQLSNVGCSGVNPYFDALNWQWK